MSSTAIFSPINGIKAACLAATAAVVLAKPAAAQRASQNILTSASDAFGTTLGRDNFGLYSSNSVRGFSPTQAGNNRIEGLYFDQLGPVTRAVRLGNSIKVGLAQLDTPFPAPTGVVDNMIRIPGDKGLGSTTIGLQEGWRANFEIEKEILFSQDAAITVSGATEYRNLISGDRGRFWAIGLAGRFNLAPGVEVKPFFGSFTNYENFSPPRWFTQDQQRPTREVNRNRIIGPSWAADGQTGTTAGVITTVDATDSLKIELGVFRSIQIRQESHSTLVQNIDAQGFGDRLVISDPRQLRTSWSGELRVAQRFTTGDFAHTILASIRGRQVNARVGGNARVNLGRFLLDERVEVARPDFNYGPLTSDKVRQRIYGVGYQGKWGDFAEIAAGVQYNDYNKRIDQPGEDLVVLGDKPIQFNGIAALNLTKKFAVYAAFTQGLEETRNPPPQAINRNELLPAQRTTQVEAGIRYSLPANLSLNAAAFKIEKPLIALDDNNVFRPRGTVIHQGIEASLAGSPMPGFTILVGGLYLDASNAGEEVNLDPSTCLGGGGGSGAGGGAGGGGGCGLGRRPVNRSPFSGRLALNWGPNAGTSPWSFDVVVEGNSPQQATRDNLVQGIAGVDIDIGLRYRFKISDNAAVFRVAINDLTNTYRWEVAGDGAWAPNNPRSVLAFLTVDI
jgi:iron complex outermembrane receptor protein